MHDIWNPWHGCIKKSEGCQNCYMFYLDKKRDMNGSIIYKTKAKFYYPLQKDRNGNYKIQSGELIRVCMTSDFFLESADSWREEAWKMMKIRSDVKFFILTKRPERVLGQLPKDWGDGYDNISINVSCENQRLTDERVPLLLKIPAKHKGIMTAPLLGPIVLKHYLEDGQIEQVICGGENYDGSRLCDYDWVLSLAKQCKDFNISFTFLETGTNFRKDGKNYTIKSKLTQSKMAFKSGISFPGKEIKYFLTNPGGIEIPQEFLYVPHYIKRCEECGNRPICNGCSRCGKCKE